MPEHQKERKEVISFRLSKETIKQLKAIANQLQTNKTKVLELLIQDGFNQLVSKPKQKEIKPSHSNDITIEWNETDER